MSRKQKFNRVQVRKAVTANIGVLLVTCDLCGRAQMEVRCLGTLEEEGAKKGWKCRKVGADLCPDCKDPLNPLPDRTRQKTIFELPFDDGAR